MLRNLTLPLLAASAIAASPSTQSSSGITIVGISAAGRQEDSGRGFFAKAKAGCFLVTAAHVVVDSGYEATSVTFRRDGGIDQSAKAVWYPSAGEGYDVAYLDAAKADDRPNECPSLLPTMAETDEALRDGRADVISVTDDGDRFRIPVEIIATKPRIVAKPLSSGDQIKRGISGSPLVIRGRPYGVVSKGGGAEIIIERLDAIPDKARRRVDSSVPPITLSLLGKYLSLIDNSGRSAYERCQNQNFEMCNLFGSALINYGLDHGDPWTQDAAAPFFAMACDHEVPWACSNIALIYKNGSMTIKPAFPVGKKVL